MRYTLFYIKVFYNFLKILANSSAKTFLKTFLNLRALFTVLMVRRERTHKTENRYTIIHGYCTTMILTISISVISPGLEIIFKSTSDDISDGL